MSQKESDQPALDRQPAFFRKGQAWPVVSRISFVLHPGTGSVKERSLVVNCHCHEPTWDSQGRLIEASR